MVADEGQIRRSLTLEKRAAADVKGGVPLLVLDDLPVAEQSLAPFLSFLIEGLPSNYREALTLTELDGLTQVEMGRRLGLSPSGAKSRVQRGRAMVREQLLDCCHVELDRRRRVIDFQPASPEPWSGGRPCDPQPEGTSDC